MIIDLFMMHDACAYVDVDTNMAVVQIGTRYTIYRLHRSVYIDTHRQGGVQAGQSIKPLRPTI